MSSTDIAVQSGSSFMGGWVCPVTWPGAVRPHRCCLDRQKISKTILDKEIFFILWCFYLFLVFVLINLKSALLRGEQCFLEYVGHIGYQKIKNFILISKK